MLREAFPDDEILPVQKGVSGREIPSRVIAGWATVGRLYGRLKKQKIGMKVDTKAQR